MKATVILAVLFMSVAAYGANGSTQDQNNHSVQSTGSAGLSQKGVDRIVKEARHQLVMLPFYGVFDNLLYKVSTDGTVTLLGEVSRPTLKSDAARAMMEIEGVERIDNQIKVLPVSPNDDRIRLATYRKIYGNSVLSQYQLRAVPPIHIIVENGHVTLKAWSRARWRNRSLKCKPIAFQGCSRLRTICECRTTSTVDPNRRKSGSQWLQRQREEARHEGTGVEFPNYTQEYSVRN